MTIQTLKSLTTPEFERRLKAWARIARRVINDAENFPGPGWEPVKYRLRNEGRMLRADRRRRSG